MNNADEPHEARDTSASTRVAHNGADLQYSTPPDVVQEPQTADTSTMFTDAYLGTSILNKRKAAGPPVSRQHQDSKQHRDSPQQSLHRSARIGAMVGRKKLKVEDNTMDQESDLFAQQDGSLSTEIDDSPSKLLSAVSSTVSFPSAHGIMELALELRNIATQIPAQPLPADGTKHPKKVPAYDAKVERQTSGLAIDDPSVEKLERMIDVVVDYVLRLLDKYDGVLIDDTVILDSQRWLKDIASPENRLPHDMTVAVVGNPGAGKSTVISNVLNLSQAAVGHGGTESCTNVRIEYSNQSALCTAVVHTSDEAKIKRRMHNHIQTMLEVKDYVEQTPADEYSKKRHDELNEERKASLDYLESLLVARGKENAFTSRSDLEEHIDAHKLKSVPRLTNYVCSFLSGCRGRMKEVEFKASNVGALQGIHELRRWAGYDTDPKDPRALWRLVDKMSISVPSLALENRVLLNDVPGINKELDKTRDETGQEAFHAYNIIMIVHILKRCNTDQTLRTMLHKCALEDKNAMLVLTNLDDLGTEAEWSTDEKSDPELSDLAAQQRALDDSDDDDFEKYFMLEQNMRERLSTIRAGKIIGTMQNVYRDLQIEYNGREGTKLSVYPVANTDYGHYMTGYNTRRGKNRPSVGIEHTGIVQLRTAIRNLPSEMKLKALLMAANELKRLIIGIHIYLTRSKLERKQHVMDFVQGPILKSEQKITRDVEALKKKLIKVLTSKPVGPACITKWQMKGEELSREWGTEHFNVYKAICSRGGNYRDHQWNNEILEIYHQGLFAAFDKVLDAVKDMKSSLPRSMIKLLGGIAVELKKSPDMAVSQEELRKFYEYIEACQGTIDALFEDFFVELDSELNDIRSKALRLEESYLAEAMQSAYDKCMEQVGKGSHDRRKQIMREKLASSGGVFDEILESAKEDLCEMLNDWLLKVLPDRGGKQKCVRQVFENVEEQFNCGYLNEDADEPKATREAKSELGNVFEEAMKVALPVLTEGMEKVQKVQDAQKVKTVA